MTGRGTWQFVVEARKKKRPPYCIRDVRLVVIGSNGTYELIGSLKKPL